MKRIRNNNKGSIKIANGMSRCSSFMVNPDKFPSDKLRRNYGKNLRVVTTGKLPERTAVTFETFISIVNGNPNRSIQCPLVDIAKFRGAANPYDEKVLEPLRQDIEALLDASIRININSDNPKKERGLRARFNLLEGYMDSNDFVDITISSHLPQIMDLTGFCYYDLKLLHHKIRKPIARQLYRFFISQNFIRHDWKYEIKVAKLCEYINWNVDDYPWYQVRKILMINLEDLKSKGVIGHCEIDKTRHKNLGGMVIVSGRKVEKRVVESKSKFPTRKASNYDKIVETIKYHLLEFDEVKELWDEEKLKNELQKLEEFFDPYSESERFDSIVYHYCKWLDGSHGEGQNIKFYSHKLFDSKNELFQKFWKWAFSITAGIDFEIELKSREQIKREQIKLEQNKNRKNGKL